MVHWCQRRSSAKVEEEATYLIQSPENYKITLLRAMFNVESMQKFADLAVFCCDGVTWTSKLLISASSWMLRDAFNQMDGFHQDTTCIMLPDITKNEFQIFHEALSSSVSNTKLDLVIVIKVAESLGVDLVNNLIIRSHLLLYSVCDRRRDGNICYF